MLYLDASDEVAKLGALGVFIFGIVIGAIANFLYSVKSSFIF